jgi:phenylacetate-CoA ligase
VAPASSPQVVEQVERLTHDEVVATLDAQLLPRQVATVLRRSAFYREKLGAVGLTPDEPLGLEELGRLPFTTKEEVLADQVAHPPFGRLALGDDLALSRVHVTSGTTGRQLLVVLTARDVQETAAAGARAFRCAGVVPGDSVVHCLSYCLWAGGVTDHLSLEAAGATVIPFGVGNTKKLIETIRLVRPTAISCTPSYMSRLQVVLREEFGLSPRDLGLQKALFGGEGGLQDPAVRGAIESTWGLRAMDANYGMADVLSIFGAECAERRGGLHFHGQGLLHVELIAPDTGAGRPCVAGAEGELVLTNLSRQAQPLIRYRTGDVVRVVATGGCECGRRSLRFAVAGRSDQMVVVRGVNVFPGAIASLLAEQRADFSGEFELVVEGPPPVERPLLRVELARPAGPAEQPALAARVVALCRERIGFTPRIELLAPGAFPRTEGKTRRVRRIAAAGTGSQA